MSEFIAFVGIAAIVIVTPGPDTARTVRNSLVGGRRGGMFTALGVSAGQAIWTVATSAGVSALLVASEPAFAAVKLAGAAYLIFLGGQAVWGALRSNGSEPSASGYASVQRLGPDTAFRQGVVSNLANPKMAVFFTSLLPQFTPRSDTTFTALLLLGLLFCSMTLGWLSAYAMALAKAGDVLRRPRIRRALEGLTGAVLIGLGLRLAIERR